MNGGRVTGMRTVPFVVTPMEPIFRRMVAVSVVLHMAALVLFSVWAALHAPPSRFLSVAVVDLVGGEAFAPPPEVSGKPAEKPAPPPAAKATKEEKPRKSPPAQTAKAEKERGTREKPVSPATRPRETESLSESIKRMREKKVSGESVREAVVTIRREKAARSAIHQIGERVGHRIDLSAVRSAQKKDSPSAPAGLAGASGTARVPPEHLAYFRQLDEKVRSNWNVPALGVGEKEKLMVQIRIVIEIDGRVSQVRMEKTSGNPYFDDSVLRAIRKASPLPVPPAPLRGSEEYYEVGFRFYGAGEES
ncbi:MAG: energy transducer TonB [Candidatus Deferrimicrobiaceae bacterium]